jgi:hypothetical protein
MLVYGQFWNSSHGNMSFDRTARLVGLLVEMGIAATVSFTPVLPTPVVCRSMDSLLALLALIVVEDS